MNITRLYPLLLVGTLLGLLAACGGPRVVAPAEATVNGVSRIDRDNGVVEFSVSGLDGENNVVESGTISNVSATVDQSGFEVDGGVCGDEEGEITSLGPVTAMLTFDASGSLEDTDPFLDNDGNSKRREGGLTFVKSMKSDARAGVSLFSDYYAFINLQELTSDKSLLNQAVVDATSVAYGGTPLWEASIKTIELLSVASGDNRIAIIFTDGEDTSYDDPNDVAAAAIAAGVRVYYVGLGDAVNTDIMSNIAGATNPSGLYVSVEDNAQLVEAFTAVSRSSQASGCIDVAFSPIPSPGQKLTGTLEFTIDGGRFSGDYEVTF